MFLPGAAARILPRVTLGPGPAPSGPAGGGWDRRSRRGREGGRSCRKVRIGRKASAMLNREKKSILPYVQFFKLRKVWQ